MVNKIKSPGFTLVELIVIVAVISIVVAIAGGYNAKFFLWRKIDSVTTGVSNTLQSAKLNAARHGVEFRTVFDQKSDSLDLIIHRGDSNTDSTVWTTVQTQTIDLDPSIVISKLPGANRFEFNPSGTSTSDSFTVIPKSTDRFKRCGDVTVHSLGRIRVVKGNWDGSDCIQIKDN